MKFYPDIKPHISPSAFAQWHTQRSAFIRSYFKGEKTPETAAMTAGKKIHALIESGLLPATHIFQCSEKKLEVMLDNGVKVLGIPDSHEKINPTITELVSFVDYKTGKENHWTKEKIATDLKMRLTAWLVLQDNAGARDVQAIIEWIGTEWNGSELVPTGETVCCDHIFTWEDLFPMNDILLKTIDDINEAYEAFLQAPTESLVDEEDVRAYTDLEAEKNKIEAKQKEIKERIGQQLEFCGQATYEHPLGTFYFTTKKTYDYPKTLKVGYRDYGLVLEDAEEIAAAASAVKKSYELDHDPVTISRSIGFRAKKNGKANTA